MLLIDARLVPGQPTIRTGGNRNREDIQKVREKSGGIFIFKNEYSPGKNFNVFTDLAIN